MNLIDPKRLGRAGSLDTPSIVRRKPSLAQNIMRRNRRNRRNAAPTRNRWTADIEFNWKGGLVLALAVVIAVGIALRIAGVL